jgi:hypothetical protein
LGGQVDEKGNILVTSRTRVLPDGELAKLVGEVKLPAEDLLAGLPNGPFVLAGSGAMPEGLGKALADFSAEMIKAMPQIYGISGKEADKLGDMTRKSMVGLRGMGMSLGVGSPGEALLSNAAAVMWVDDAQKYLDNYEKLVKAMAEMGADSDTSFFKDMKIEKVRIDDLDARKITFQFPTEMPGIGEVPELRGIIDVIYGPGGKMTAFLAAADEHTVVSSYGSEEVLKQCVKAAKDPKAALSARKEVAKTAAMLPQGSQWVGYLSPKGLIDLINRLAPLVMFEPGKKNILPDFPETPAVGFSAKAVQGELQTTCLVPAAVMKAIAQYIGDVQKMEQIDPSIP